MDTKYVNLYWEEGGTVRVGTLRFDSPVVAHMEAKASGFAGSYICTIRVTTETKAEVINL